MSAHAYLVQALVQTLLGSLCPLFDLCGTLLPGCLGLVNPVLSVASSLLQAVGGYRQCIFHVRSSSIWHRTLDALCDLVGTPIPLRALQEKQPSKPQHLQKSELLDHERYYKS